MSDFDFNEHMQENAGYYGALGGMMYLRNQQKQSEELRKQRGLLERQTEAIKAQLASAATQQEQLKIEKRRLELDEERDGLRRQQAEQVKEVRKLMAGISSELDEIDARFA